VFEQYAAPAIQKEAAEWFARMDVTPVQVRVPYEEAREVLDDQYSGYGHFTVEGRQFSIEIRLTKDFMPILAAHAQVTVETSSNCKQRGGCRNCPHIWERPANNLLQLGQALELEKEERSR